MLEIVLMFTGAAGFALCVVMLAVNSDRQNARIVALEQHAVRLALLVAGLGVQVDASADLVALPTPCRFCGGRVLDDPSIGPNGFCSACQSVQ